MICGPTLPPCREIIDGFVELGEVGLVGIVILAAPPFDRRRAPRGTPDSPMARRCPREGSVRLVREHWLRKADDGEDALDLDPVRPAVAKVVPVLRISSRID